MPPALPGRPEAAACDPLVLSAARRPPSTHWIRLHSSSQPLPLPASSTANPSVNALSPLATMARRQARRSHACRSARVLQGWQDWRGEGWQEAVGSGALHGGRQQWAESLRGWQSTIPSTARSLPPPIQRAHLLKATSALSWRRLGKAICSSTMPTLQQGAAEAGAGACQWQCAAAVEALGGRKHTLDEATLAPPTPSHLTCTYRSGRAR